MFVLIGFKIFFGMFVDCIFLVVFFIWFCEDFDYIEELDIFYEIFGYMLFLIDFCFVCFFEVIGWVGLLVDKL